MLVGMALGVAVVFAVDIANESAKRAFALSLDTVTGRTTHQIVGGSNGLDESIYTRLRTELGIRSSAPVVQGTLELLASGDSNSPGAVQSLQLIGVDLFAEPMFRDQVSSEDQANQTENDTTASSTLASLQLLRQGAVILADNTASRLGITRGQQVSISGSDLPLELISLVDAEQQPGFENIAMVDISTAQLVLGLQGQLSRIDLVLPSADQQGLEQSIEQIEKNFPGVRVTEAARRNDSLTQMTGAFHTNLLAMSLLALLVGAFLIYNTVTLSVIQRRQTFGQLRAVGVQRHELFRSILSETLFFAVIGTVMGLIIGYLLGSVLLSLVTRTINDLYFTLDVRQVEYSGLTLLKACLIGLGVSLLSALPPALEASNSPPGAVIQRTSVERRVGRLAPMIFVAGLLLVAAGLLILIISSTSLWAAFLAIFCLVFGYSLLIPQALITLTALAGREKSELAKESAKESSKRFSKNTAKSSSTAFSTALGSYPLRSTTASLSRTAVAIAALAVSVSATAGVGIMIGSFRLSVENWLVDTLQADVYISAQSSEPIADSIISKITSLDNLKGVREARMAEVETDLLPVRLMAIRTTGESTAPYIFKADANRTGITERDNLTSEQRFQSLADADRVIISEPFANQSNLQVDDTIVLITDHGTVPFTIAGVFTNYTTGKGLVVIDMSTYHKHWNDRGISSIGLSLEELDGDGSGEAARTTKSQLRAIIADEPLSMRSNTEIRQRSLQIFDRTFAITHVLRLLTIGVAFVGILSALMALSLERRAEYAVLRALGITPAELRKLMMMQTGLMGLIAGVLALPLGIAMSQILVSVINVRSFGWTMEYSIPPRVLVESLILAIIAALLAGLYPAHKLSRLSPAEALRHQ